MSTSDAELTRLLEEAGLRVKRNVPARQLTTMAAGAAVPQLAVAESEESLVRAMKLFQRTETPWRILGAGSNVVLPDDPFRGWILQLGRELGGFEVRSNGSVSVGGAARFMTIARQCAQAGLSGLEFAAGIPATMGGAAYMNAGAHGAEIAERISRITVINAAGERIEYGKRDLPWRYRHSGLPGDVIVTSVELALTPGDSVEISAHLAHNLLERKKRQPLAFPSSGSVFKNPSPTEFAGALIEACGLKGHTCGGASISELHANWIINRESTATAADVRQLVEVCRDEVFKKSRIRLEPEVRMWDS